jgi:starvation-inducible DNA-binding protein
MAHGDNSKKALADALNGLLADYYALYLKTKNFHWHVTGPHFREYHLLFDEQATELIATTDLVAERVRKLGQDTLTSIGAIAAKQRINDHDSTSTDAPKMLKELHADNETLIKALNFVSQQSDLNCRTCSHSTPNTISKSFSRTISTNCRRPIYVSNLASLKA